MTSIQRMDLAGTSGKILVFSGSPAALTIDYRNDRLYWLENTANLTCIIRSSDLNGAGVTTVAENIPQCQSESIEFSMVNSQQEAIKIQTM